MPESSSPSKSSSMRRDSATFPIFSCGSSFFLSSVLFAGFSGFSSSGGITPSISSISRWISGGRIGSAVFLVSISPVTSPSKLSVSVSATACLASVWISGSSSITSSTSRSSASSSAISSVRSSASSSAVASSSSTVSSSSSPASRSFSGAPSQPERISSRLICPVIWSSSFLGSSAISASSSISSESSSMISASSSMISASSSMISASSSMISASSSMISASSSMISASSSSNSAASSGRSSSASSSVISSVSSASISSGRISVIPLAAVTAFLFFSSAI